jgi:hypothetical protein
VSKIVRATAVAQISKPTSGATSHPADFGESTRRQVWKPTLLSFLSLSFVAFPYVLAMRPLRTLRCAQAREAEAETL